MRHEVVGEGSAATGRLRLTVDDADAFVRDLVTNGAPFERLTVRGASLEEAFLALTLSDQAAPVAATDRSAS